MNKTKIFALQLLLCSAVLVQSVQAFVTAKTYTNGVTATAFDKQSGQLVIGKTAATGELSLIQYFDAANGTDTQTATNVVNGANTEAVVARCLALSKQPTTSTNIRAVYVNSGTPTILRAISLDGTNAATLAAAAILDGAGAENGAIRAVEANSTHVFMGVAANGAATWGAANSGIGVATIADTTANTLAFTGGTGANALLVDNTVAWVRGDHGSTAPTISDIVPAIHWCSGLARLYVGIQASSGAADDDAVRNLTIAKMNTNDLTIVHLIAGDHTAPLSVGLAAGTSNIVGASNSTAAARYYAMHRIDSMKTSSGHYYLIVNGGLDNVGRTLASNKIFAIPLVDSDGDVPGALASVESLSVGTTNFKKNALALGKLFLEDSAPAIVGKGTLPVAAAVGAVTQMTVVGDTVFCATQATPGATNEPGLYYSQALFNADGSIGGWTYWAKAVPNEVSGDAAADGSCFAFAVDPIRGKIWAIADDVKTIVKVTQWTKDTTEDTLGGSVNNILEGPCYSSLFLSQHTVNYGNLNLRDFAFFGGKNKVVVVKTGTTGTAGYTSIMTPTADWTTTTAQATSISTGLENVGEVTALGWTNQNGVVADNYLLAGTNGGLYAFVSSADAGIITAEGNPSDVNAAPFSTYTWKKIDKISDPVVKIISTTNGTDCYTFVLTHGDVHKLWRITVTAAATLTALNTATVAVWTAEAMHPAHATDPSFLHDINIVGLTSGQYVSIATDKGLYIVPFDAAADLFKTNYATRLVLHSETNDVRHLHGAHRTHANQNLHCARWFERKASSASTNHTTCSSLGTIHFNSTPTTYTHLLKGDTLAFDGSVLPLAAPISHHYSNGAFRFFVESQRDHTSTLHIVPHHNGSSDYNISAIADLGDAVISNVGHIYWVHDIAGYLMAGTDDGIIVLR